MTDIGNELKKLRQQKGLSLQEISNLTRINSRYLEYLEENNFAFLPEVYVKSFLKTYVKALGGDEKIFFEALNEALNPKEKIYEEISPQQDTEKLTKTQEEIFPLKKFLIGKTNILTFKNIFFVVLSILILFIFFYLILSKQHETKEMEKVTSAEQMFEQTDHNNSQIISNFAQVDSLILAINAKDSVWIQIKIDDTKIEEVYLRNGDMKKFKAKNDFQLLIGNAGAVILYLNETELPFTGVKGSVKRLKVDKDGVKLIQVKNEPKRQ